KSGASFSGSSGRLLPGDLGDDHAEPLLELVLVRLVGVKNRLHLLRADRVATLANQVENRPDLVKVLDSKMLGHRHEMIEVDGLRRPAWAGLHRSAWGEPRWQATGVGRRGIGRRVVPGGDRIEFLLELAQ